MRAQAAGVDMNYVEFNVFGRPVAKQRHRMTKSGQTYTPKQTAGYERMVKLIAGAEMQGRPIFLGPVEMVISVYLAVPKRWNKKQKAAAKAKLILPTKKPDVSNIAKSIEDAMNGVVYRDDSQIFKLTVGKWYAVGEEEYAHVWVRENSRQPAP